MKKKTHLYFVPIFIISSLIILFFMGAKNTSNPFLINYEESVDSIKQVKQEAQNLSLFLVNQMRIEGREKIKSTLPSLKNSSRLLFTKVETINKRVKNFKNNTSEKLALVQEIGNLQKAIQYIDIGIVSIEKLEDFDPINSFYDALFNASSFLKKSGSPNPESQKQRLI